MQYIPLHTPHMPKGRSHETAKAFDQFFSKFFSGKVSLQYSHGIDADLEG